MLRIGALNLLMNVGGNVLFMHWFGVKGIAMSTSLMYVVATLATFAAIRVKLAEARPPAKSSIDRARRTGSSGAARKATGSGSASNRAFNEVELCPEDVRLAAGTRIRTTIGSLGAALRTPSKFNSHSPRTPARRGTVASTIRASNRGLAAWMYSKSRCSFLHTSSRCVSADRLIWARPVMPGRTARRR